MKIIFDAMLLYIIQFCFTRASPMSKNDIKLADNLPATKDEHVTMFNGYNPTPGIGIHKYHNAQRKSWNEARNTCLNEGGHLAVISSAAEEALIVKYMNVTGNHLDDQLWIGIHELFKKDDWVSVKDQRFDAIGYAHWKTGQPDAAPNEHCLTITPYGMNDYVCDKPLFFVCEM